MKRQTGKKSSVSANATERYHCQKTNLLAISFHIGIHVLGIEHKAVITIPNPCIHPSSQQYRRWRQPALARRGRMPHEEAKGLHFGKLHRKWHDVCSSLKVYWGPFLSLNNKRFVTKIIHRAYDKKAITWAASIRKASWDSFEDGDDAESAGLRQSIRLLTTHGWAEQM